MTVLSRRQAIFAGAMMPFAATMATRPAFSQAEMLGSGFAPWNRFKLGRFEVTTLLSGTRAGDKPQETFGTNASAEDFAALSAENFLPADRTQNFFTPTLVNTGAELILFDTGLAADGTVAAMAAAGVTPDQVDVVVLTHMHGDHIGGLMGADGVTPTFTNARYVTGAIEHNHWSGAANEGFDRNVKPLNDKITFLEDAGSVASGITGVNAFGHSPGHMVYHVESDGQRLMITADTANLHIHLNSRNTFARTSYLKVHIASKIFGICNICEYIWRITVHHKTHCNTTYWSLNWYSGIHKSKYRATCRRHRC